ncbi:MULTISPECIES: hypothetical protein [Leptospira]|uniref:hypothetical protein n=1 Tax=Leptospira TaxID=171 RepID=UPI000773335A|nr:hypothetical protein [Leptospira noguchii]
MRKYILFGTLFYLSFFLIYCNFDPKDPLDLNSLENDGIRCGISIETYAHTCTKENPNYETSTALCIFILDDIGKQCGFGF